MGCFNVSCGVSAISMYVDDAVLIPLLPTRAGTKNHQGANLVSNSGAQVLYYPVTLPIFGSLDSYGRLEDIVRDANVEAIEKCWGTSIDEFAEAVAHGEQAGFAGMFVHRKIYDLLANNQIDEFGKPATYIWDEGYLKDDVLQLAGFEFVREDKKRERYNKLWGHPSFPGIEVWSDGTWCDEVVFVQGKKNKKGHAGYRLQSLVGKMEELTGKTFPKDIKTVLQSTRHASMIFDRHCKMSKARIEAQAKIDGKMGVLDQAELAMARLEARAFVMGEHCLGLANEPYDCKGNEYPFERIYKDHLDAIKPNYVDWIGFNLGLTAVNRIYAPSANGYQHGNHYLSSVLYAKSLEIVEAKIKESKDDE